MLLSNISDIYAKMGNQDAASQGQACHQGVPAALCRDGFAAVNGIKDNIIDLL